MYYILARKNATGAKKTMNADAATTIIYHRISTHLVKKEFSLSYHQEYLLFEPNGVNLNL